MWSTNPNASFARINAFNVKAKAKASAGIIEFFFFFTLSRSSLMARIKDCELSFANFTSNECELKKLTKESMTKSNKDPPRSNTSALASRVEPVESLRTRKKTQR